MAAPLTLSLNLDEIVAGGSVRVTNDGLLYAVDLVMIISDKNRDEAGMVLRRLPEEVFASIKAIERRTPGKGNAKTKLISFTDAIELISIGDWLGSCDW